MMFKKLISVAASLAIVATMAANFDTFGKVDTSARYAYRPVSASKSIKFTEADDCQKIYVSEILYKKPGYNSSDLDCGRYWCIPYSRVWPLSMNCEAKCSSSNYTHYALIASSHGVRVSGDTPRGKNAKTERLVMSYNRRNKTYTGTIGGTAYVTDY